MLMDDIRRNPRYDLPLSTRRRSTSESLAKKVLIEVLPFLPHLVFLPSDRDLVFVFFSCGFTLSTSAITSLNGSGMCGIGFAFVVRFGLSCRNYHLHKPRSI